MLVLTNRYVSHELAGGLTTKSLPTVLLSERNVKHRSAGGLTTKSSETAVLSNRYVKHKLAAVVYVMSAANSFRRLWLESSSLTTATDIPRNSKIFPILQPPTTLWMFITRILWHTDSKLAAIVCSSAWEAVGLLTSGLGFATQEHQPNLCSSWR